MHPRSLFVLDLHLHAVADLRTGEGLAAWGLTLDDLTRNDFTRCQKVVTVAARHGAEAIRWKSATGAGESCGLFVARLLPGSSIDIREEFELSHAALAHLDAGSAVADLIPELQALPLLDR